MEESRPRARKTGVNRKGVARPRKRGYTEEQRANRRNHRLLAGYARAGAQCSSTTKKGSQCKRPVVEGKSTCWQHSSDYSAPLQDRQVRVVV